MLCRRPVLKKCTASTVTRKGETSRTSLSPNVSPNRQRLTYKKLRIDGTVASLHPETQNWRSQIVCPFIWAVIWVERSYRSVGHNLLNRLNLCHWKSTPMHSISHLLDMSSPISLIIVITTRVQRICTENYSDSWRLTLIVIPDYRHYNTDLNITVDLMCVSRTVLRLGVNRLIRSWHVWDQTVLLSHIYKSSTKSKPNSKTYYMFRNTCRLNHRTHYTH